MAAASDATSSKTPFQDRLSCASSRAGPATHDVTRKDGGAKSSAPSTPAATAAARKATAYPAGTRSSRAAHTASTGTRPASYLPACAVAADRPGALSVRKPSQPCRNSARANAASHAMRTIAQKAHPAAQARVSSTLASAPATSAAVRLRSRRASSQEDTRGARAYATTMR